MRNFLLGVVVGAVGMGFYTGHIKITDSEGKPFQPFEKDTTTTTTTEGVTTP